MKHSGLNQAAVSAGCVCLYILVEQSVTHPAEASMQKTLPISPISCCVGLLYLLCKQHINKVHTSCLSSILARLTHSTRLLRLHCSPPFFHRLHIILTNQRPVSWRAISSDIPDMTSSACIKHMMPLAALLLPLQTILPEIHLI